MYPRYKLLTPSPPILHACHDSRIEALKSYNTTAFNTKDENGQIKNEIYVNPAIDVLLLQPAADFKSVSTTDPPIMKTAKAELEIESW